MLLNAKKIIGLPVETNNGTKIGKVADFNLDIESHIVNSYAVRSQRLPLGGGFIHGENLIISRSQVLSVSDKKMVVEDSAVRERIKSGAPKNALVQKTEPVLTVTSK